jgi:hypothetical protein
MLEAMAPSRRPAVRKKPSAVRERRPRDLRVRDSHDAEISVASLPTASELRELGRIADRVAKGREPLFRIKL